MATPRKLSVWTILWSVVAVSAAVGLIFVFTLIGGWWAGKGEAAQGPEQPLSHQLVRGADGRPSKPYTIWLSPTTVKALKITSAKVRPAGDLLLPPQPGILGYDTDRLYSVRPRFQGEIIEIAKVNEFQRVDGSTQVEARPRPYGPGDYVRQGQVLAIAWSKELGDRKVNLITNLLALYLDRELLKFQEEYSAAVPEATLRATRAKVQTDLATVYAAESALGIARLTPKEIEEIRKEARVIQQRLQDEMQQPPPGKPETPEQRLQRLKEQRLKRLREDVPRWARVEIVAPQTGVIVEKNTNVNDMVDPSKDTPLFRIADLSSLLINVNFNEEYLPLLQPLLRHPGGGWSFFEEIYRLLELEPFAQEAAQELRWKIHFEALTDLPVLALPVLRIAPSLDPNNHTAMVIGRIPNPVKDSKQQDRRLIVGQFVTATVVVPPVADVVEIPTTALNEVNGESLVLVQPDPDKTEYVLRRVAVVRRARDFTQVRSKLTPQDEAQSEEEVREGRRPIEPLRVGELLVTRGVTEITDAFEALLAKIRVEKR
jgi:cobalt-zinc-cadmium efflux system membrane fusion protein